MKRNCKMHPVLILVIVSMVLMLFATGCQNKTSDSESEKTSAAMTTTAAVTENPFAEKVTINVADFNYEAESSDLFTVEGQKNFDLRWKLMAEKFNVRIQYCALDYATHQEQLRTMISANDMPDVMISTLPVSEYQKFVDDGLIRLLPENYEAKYPNIEANLKLIPGSVAFKNDGRYFAVPRSLEGKEPYFDYNSSLYYRKDLAQSVGVTIKEAYTVDEVFDMYTKVKAANPDMIMFNHIWPDQVKQLGLIQAMPEIGVYGNDFYLDPATNKYVYAYRNPRIVEGIKTFKKFYENGFIDKEFYSKPMYEARNQFSTNTLFSCFDGFDVMFFDQVLKNYKKSNPDSEPAEKIGFAWLLDNDGNLQGVKSGNSWSEYIFNAEIKEKVLDRFLSLYDYLIGDEGLRLNFLGIEGVHYKMDGNKVVSLRKIDESTGLPVPFNSNKEIADWISPLITGSLADSRVNNINPAYSDFAKETVNKFWTLRKNTSNLKVINYDAARTMFTGDYYSKSTLKPLDAIYKIIYENKADNVEQAWNRWLSDNAKQIDNILNELNSNLVK